MHQSRNLTFLVKFRGIATKVNNKRDDKIFGLLSDKGKHALSVSFAEKYLPDDEDGYDKEVYDSEPRKNHFYYKYEISKYARQGSVGLRKALELFDQMKSKDRVSPEVGNFSALIYGCAKAGYTQKAFELYEESLRFKSRPTNSTVTCLINACAESPFKDYGVERLNWLRDHLKFEYNYTMNQIQYHSAIKAYGKLGQLEDASKLVKEMIDNNIALDVTTFSMLLIGCASDKEMGATYALRIYKRMKYYGVKPNIFTYNLLLRCIRDCGMGPPELIKQAIAELPAMTTLDQKIMYKKFDKTRINNKRSRNQNFEWVPLIDDLGKSLDSIFKQKDEKLSQEDPKCQTTPSDNTQIVTFGNDSASELIAFHDLQIKPSTSSLPNLLSDDHLDLFAKILSINVDQLHKPTNRLLLFGGPKGYLEQMKRNDCEPNEKTFSILIGCIKHEPSSQLEYFELSENYQIKRDLLFYNILIRQICEAVKDRARLKRALNLLEEMQKDGLRPDLFTYESLAIGVDNWVEAQRLIDDVEKTGFTISDIMIARFFDAALYKPDFPFLCSIIRFCMKRQFEPNKRLVESLEDKKIFYRELILKEEKGLFNEDDRPKWLQKGQIKYFDKFVNLLKIWLKITTIKDEEHPWNQFYFEKTDRRKGYRQFVEHFERLNRLKDEALESGQKLENLAAKTNDLMLSQSKRAESKKLG